MVCAWRASSEKILIGMETRYRGGAYLVFVALSIARVSLSEIDKIISSPRNFSVSLLIIRTSSHMHQIIDMRDGMKGKSIANASRGTLK